MTTFAADEAVEAAGKVERLARSGDLTGINDAISSLTFEIERVLSALAELADDPELGQDVPSLQND